MALLQIALTLITPRLPSPATLLFNRPAKGILPKISITLVLFDSDKSDHSALVNKQVHANEDEDTNKNISFVPIESIVVVQCKETGPWACGTTMGHGSDDKNGRSYRIRVTKIENTTTRTKRHIKANQSQKTTSEMTC